ncbi:6515_t:CDS:2, partial [Ambispora leptoticha]
MIYHLNSTFGIIAAFSRVGIAPAAFLGCSRFQTSQESNPNSKLPVKTM